MDKIILTTFTDPMMGLSYECEPIMRKLETHFAGQIEFKYSMGLLVRNVYELADCNELAQSPILGLHRYNARLAKIYESEERISGMPINMEGFCLFDTEHTSSLPLNLAYKAAQLAAPERADMLLYYLRYATIVETRQTTRLEEILRVVRMTGIDEQRFLQHYCDSTAETALDSDLTRMHALGIHTLPAYLLEYGGKQMLIRQLIGYDSFVEAIRQLSDGCIQPQPAEQSADTIRRQLETHPLISPIELREAFDFRTTDDVRHFIQPLIDSGEVSIRDVKHGWFIVKTKKGE